MLLRGLRTQLLYFSDFLFIIDLKNKVKHQNRRHTKKRRLIEEKKNYLNINDCNKKPVFTTFNDCFNI